MKPFMTINGAECIEATEAITDAITGKYPLSGYLGSYANGGQRVNLLEEAWEKRFGVRYAVAVNSATSGLLAACMAVGVSPGSEVIVSPYTMSATAAAPKLLGAQIVFADIEPDTFTLDPVEVANAITPKTKAVIVTNLFGHPGHLHELRELCDDHGIYLIEDNAQAILSQEQGCYAGTIGHIGVFSLNVHKHIQVGEGGICVTDDTILDGKLREAMNHGEMRGGIIGLNLRMTEVTAAMAKVQLEKLGAAVKSRQALASYLLGELQPMNGIRHVVRNDCESSYYCLALICDGNLDNIPKPWKRGYLHPLYSLPAFGQTSLSLPVVEEVERKIVLLELCSIDPTEKECRDLVVDLKRALDGK